MAHGNSRKKSGASKELSSGTLHLVSDKTGPSDNSLRAFNADAAMSYLRDISKTMDEIHAIACTAIAAQEAKGDGADLMTTSLFRVIEGLTEDATNFYALEEMFEPVRAG